MEEALKTLTPYIRVALDSVIKPPWKLKNRVIFDYELLYVKGGEILVNIEGTEYKGQQGDIFIFKPKQTHSILIIGDKDFHQPHLHFDLHYLPDSPDVKVSFLPLEKISLDDSKYFRYDETSGWEVHLPNIIRLKSNWFIEKMLFDIITEYNSKTPFYMINMQGLFLQLLAHILYGIESQGISEFTSNYEQLIIVKKYINTNTNKNITLNELSILVNISKCYLNRLFSEAFQIGPIRYHQKVRIEKAKELLTSTNISISVIAEELGFQSIHSFTRAFKNVEGIAPSVYRKRFIMYP